MRITSVVAVVLLSGAAAALAAVGAASPAVASAPHLADPHVPAAAAKKPKPVNPKPFTTEAGRLTHLDFDTADRNLHCGIWDTSDSNFYYGCTIVRRSYREPKDTPRCRQYYGHGFVARFGKAPRAACRGDVLFDGEVRRVKVLQSGQELSYGAIVCSVSGKSVTCGDQRGNGFTLSASKYTLRKE